MDKLCITNVGDHFREVKHSGEEVVKKLPKKTQLEYWERNNF